MTTHYRLFPDRRFVYSVATGDVTGDELISHGLALRADADFSPDFMQIADFRWATDVHLSSEDVQRLVAMKTFAPKSRRALLVNNDFLFGMARMYQIRTEVAEGVMLATRSVDDAWAWVGRGTDAPERPLVDQFLAEITGEEPGTD